MRKGIPAKAVSCAGGRGTGLAFETRPNPPDKPPNPTKRFLKIIRNEIRSLKHRRRMCPKFEDLEAWRAARKSVNAVYALTRKGELAKDFGLRDQLQRASVSVMTNIAEGFERAGPAEKLHFYNIARASCGEVRSLLYVVEDNYPNSSEHLPGLRESVNLTGSLLSGLMASTRKRLIGKTTGLIALLFIPATYLFTQYSF